MSDPMQGTFRSLRGFNYRVWAAGGIVSNIGTWMQRIAQDWLVLTQLTHNNAAAVGVVMALQFGPQILLLPLTGFTADHVDRRKLLYATQAALGILALALAVLTIIGLVQLWQCMYSRCCSDASPHSMLRRADLRLRPGRRGRSVECSGVEFHIVQRSAHDRSRCCRAYSLRPWDAGGCSRINAGLVCCRAVLVEFPSDARTSPAA